MDNPADSTDFPPPAGGRTGSRAPNERLVLTLVRQAGALPKSDIARTTGLSAQTAGVIMRRLERDGLLTRTEPVRGKIGQPSVPMTLAADGAYFLGLKVGRRSTDLVLVDFLGQPVARRRRTYPWPTPDAVVGFVEQALPDLLLVLPPERRDRVAGLGIAMPFQLWQWAGFVGAPQAQMDAWRDRDIGAEIALLSGLPVSVQNDATAACGAELVFGSGPRADDFLYIFIAHFIGGGLVLDGSLQTGALGNAAALGSMPVPAPWGGTRQLIATASLATLERMAREEGADPSPIWDAPEGWALPARVVEAWLDQAATGIAHAILSAGAVIDLGAAVMDGWLPADLRDRLVARTATALEAMDFSGLNRPTLRAGSIGPEARTLGAAAIPLAQRYLLDPRGLPRV